MTDLERLKDAKKHSDLRQYKYKHDVLAFMMNRDPEKFIVDSKEGDIYGITHTPTKFKIHVPRKYVPSNVKHRD